LCISPQNKQGSRYALRGLCRVRQTFDGRSTILSTQSIEIVSNGRVPYYISMCTTHGDRDGKTGPRYSFPCLNMIIWHNSSGIYYVFFFFFLILFCITMTKYNRSDSKIKSSSNLRFWLEKAVYDYTFGSLNNTSDNTDLRLHRKHCSLLIAHSSGFCGNILRRKTVDVNCCSGMQTESQFQCLV